MAKKNFSGILEESLQGRNTKVKEVKEPETVVVAEEPVKEEVVADVPAVKEENISEQQKLNLSKLEPQPTELLGSGILIAGKRGTTRQPRTVNFEEDLLKKVESLAKEHNISFSAVINQVLRQVL